jgi:CHAT domain-containing protein
MLTRKHTERQEAAAKEEIDTLLKEYRELQALIRARSPSYAALTQPQPVSLREIQERVLDGNTLLLEYSLGEERSFFWAVTTAGLAAFELPKRAQIDSAARRVYELLTERNRYVAGESPERRSARAAQADAQFKETSAALSHTLLGPVSGVLGRNRLLVVADGALQYLPFSTLPAPADTAGRPLVFDHEVVHLPSASVMAVLRSDLAGRPVPPKTLAVIADPVFERGDPRVKRPNIAAPAGGSGQTDLERAASELGLTHFPRLVFTRREALGILSMVPSQAQLSALDFAANRATATSSKLSQYRIVHVATHGLLDTAHPELSGIVLSLVDDRGRPQDGFLRLHEIYNLKLPADLVFLSACQTALGKEVKGEGLLGLVRGFMYAGAARVAASLWRVDDEATSELVKLFYEAMLGPEHASPAAALRAAQLAISSQKRWQAPYYWAAFTLQGEWR